MKMSEFLVVSKKEKVSLLDGCAPDYELATEDLGACSQCGEQANAGDFCFGCQKLICLNCIETEPHLSECWEE